MQPLAEDIQEQGAHMAFRPKEKTRKGKETNSVAVGILYGGGQKVWESSLYIATFISWTQTRILSTPWFYATARPKEMV